MCPRIDYSQLLTVNWEIKSLSQKSIYLSSSRVLQQLEVITEVCARRLRQWRAYDAVATNLILITSQPQSVYCHLLVVVDVPAPDTSLGQTGRVRRNATGVLLDVIIQGGNNAPKAAIIPQFRRIPTMIQGISSSLSTNRIAGFE